jgi:hypothetical protein
MDSPAPDLGELARRLVLHEAGRLLDPAGSAAAVERACEKLRGDLAELLGSGGVSALFRRALHLARREHSVLVGVSTGAERAVCFPGLAEALAGGTDDEAAAASAAVLRQLLGLLVMLLGEELGMQPVRKLWPEVASD